MKFCIEQVAIFPADPAKARELLRAMGAVKWVDDHVKAEGEVFGFKAGNEADLAFNYELLADANEFEILDYTHGPSWMDNRRNQVSHLGMHCTAEDLVRWREFFAERGIPVAQEVKTKSHTNAAISGKRWYQYVIFDTRPILGVDLKFIVRRDAE